MGHIETLRATLDALEAKDVGTLAGLLSDDFAIEGNTALGKQQMLAYMRALFTAFPDFSFGFGKIKEAGDNLQVEMHESGTHTGTFDLNPLGAPVTFPPTGRTFSLPVATVEFTVRDGKIIWMKEHTTEGGGLDGILAQLGVSPPGS